MAITEFTVSSSNTNKWASVSTSAVGGSTKYGIYVTNASNPRCIFQNSNFYPTTTPGSIALVELYANSEGTGNGDPNTDKSNFVDGVCLTNSNSTSTYYTYVYGVNSNTKYHYYVYNFANNGYSDTKIMAIGGNKNRRVFAIRSWGNLDVNYNKPYIMFGGNASTLHYNGASAGYSVGCAGATRGTTANAWVTHTAGDGTKYYAITNNTNNCNAYAAIALTAGHTYRFTLHAHSEAGYDGVAICKTTNSTTFDSLTASDLLSGSTSTGKCSGNNAITTFNYVEMGAEDGEAVSRYIYFKTNGLGIGVNTTISDSHGNIISSSYNGKSFADVMVEDLGDLRSTQTAPTAANVTVEYGQTAKASASGGGGQGTLQYRALVLKENNFMWDSWTTTAPTRTEVGVTQYQARWSGNTSYKASSASTTAKLTVVPKQITKPTANENLLYNGSGQLGVNNIPEGTYAAGNGTVSATNAGSYSVTYTLTNTTNYCWADGTTNPVTVNWSIAPRGVSSLNWGTRSWTYDGNSHSTTCTVGNLIGSDSCTVTLSGNSITNVGTTTVTATALSNSNYVLPSNTSITTTTLTVYAREVTLTWGTRSWTYDGSSHSTTCTAGNLVSGTTCTVTLSNNSITNVGSVTVTAASLSNSNYKLPSSKTTTLTVNPRTVTLNWGTTSWVYNGSAHSTTCTAGNLVSGTTCTVTLSGNSITNVGSTTVTAASLNNGNYTLPSSKTAKLTVTPLTATLKWGTTSWTYDGNSHSTTCTVSNLVGSDSCTVTLSGNSIKSAGSTTVTAASLNNGNYQLPSNKTATLTVYAKEAALSWGTRSWTYDGNSHSTTCTVSNLISGDSCKVTLNGNSIKTVGSATVTATSLSNGNYKLPSSKTATLTVTPRTVTLSWGTTSWTYDGSAHSTTCTAGNLVGSDSCTVTLSGNSIKNVGSTTVKATSLNNGNYQLPSNKTATLTVNPRTVTLNWGTRSWTYDGNTHSTTCTAGNLVGSDSCTVTLNNNSIKNVGSVTVTAASLNNGNYALPSSKTATLTVTAKEATLKWGTLTWLYDGTAHSTTCTVSNLVGSDSCTVTLSGNSITNVGTTTVTATALSNGNYKLPSSKTATLRINPCMYFKKAGSWVPVKEIYKKVNGSWVKQTTAANIKNVFSTSGKYLGRYLDGSTWKNLIG